MNYGMVLHILGLLLETEAALMILPVLVGIVNGESATWAFVITMAVIMAVTLPFVIRKPKKQGIYSRESFVIVAVGWIAFSFFGALPFVFSGEIPNLIDAIFEAVSGFTTTGASILTDVEVLSRSILFWRSFTHWVGGMGVLVFIMAVMPLAGSQNIFILRAESPGPSVTKLVARTRRTALILYGIYLAMTLVEAVMLMFGGLGFLDSIMLSCGTAGTGGFSVLNSGIASYSPYIQIVITVFMIMFGVNFSCYFLLFTGNIKNVFRNQELRVYLSIIFAAVAVITVNVRSLFSSLGEALRHVFFTVGSLITTTGYCTTDFDIWPMFSKVLLLLLMICGACAGSTGGGVKVSRMMVVFTQLKKEFKIMIHPGTVGVTKVEGKPLAHETARNINMFFVAYFSIMALSVLLVSLSEQDFSTCFSSVIATLNNIGPGLSKVGATGNYAGMSYFAKIVLSFDMLFGRLEIFPLLLIFVPGTWRR